MVGSQKGLGGTSARTLMQATHAHGLREVPYYWAGVFVLEAARFLFPKVHFGLVDNDCVPVTLFEMQDLIALAENQFRWTDLTGYRADPDFVNSKPGMLLFTEAHLEYNAVWSYLLAAQTVLVRLKHHQLRRT